MDWLDAYLNGMENYKTTISPADTHMWGVKPKMNNIQERLQFDAAAQSEVEYRQLIQEARQDLEAHGMSQHDVACGIGADPGSPASNASITVTPTPTVTPSMTRTPAPSNTPSTTPTVTQTPTVTPTASPVAALPNNPAGPISFVSTKSSGNTWFQIRTSTGYAKTSWWDGSSQVDGYPNPNSYIGPTKTAIGGTRTISVSSCNASGVLSGSITGWNCQYANLISVNAAGCRDMTNFVQSNESAISAINITGCTNIAQIFVETNPNLNSLLMNGCTGFSHLSITGNPKISYLDLSGHSILTNCTLQSNGLTGINLQNTGLSSYGLTLSMADNKFTALDLNQYNARINYVDVSNTPTLSSLVLPANAYASANMSQFNCSLCSLTSLNMTRLSGGVLYQFDVSYNKLTSIDVPAGWSGRTGYHSADVNVRNNNLNATALNNFFTTLGTYIGVYDVYGAGGTIYISGNPGAATCNTSIATAKGWQPSN